MRSVAAPAERYTIEWSIFDNASGLHRNIGGEQTVTAPAAQAPSGLSAQRPEYVAARIRAFHRDQPAWSRPLMAYFRQTGHGWILVGLDRN